MSHKKFYGNEELEEIPAEKSFFESKRNTEGDKCLFFKREEVDELMGHYVKFYKNGVLLVLKDDAKDYSFTTNPKLKYESKSFAFYNDLPVEDGKFKKPVFEIHNRNRSRESSAINPPIKDIDVKVYEHFLLVREIGATTTEYTVDILTGEKTYFVNNENQLSFDI